MRGAKQRRRLGRFFVAAVAAVGAAVLPGARGAAPIARHFAINVGAGAEKLVRVRGYDLDGDTLTATVTRLPEAGSLYQLSQPYSAYGYEPKRGVAVAAGDVVTGSSNRIVYMPPENSRSPKDRWGWLEYQLNDGTSSSVKQGYIALLGTDGILRRTTFDFDHDGWSVTNNGAGGVGISHQPYSRGLLNQYIGSRDDEINIHSTNGDDVRRWYFVAPSVFFASSVTNPTNSLAFGGKLKFTLSSSSGDFSSANLNTNLEVVVLECSTCDSGHGIRLVLRPGSQFGFDGKEKIFSVDLRPSGGWLKDSKNSLLPFTTPTDCEMVEVLHGLSKFHILGDWTRWYESVSLDDVSFSAGPTGSLPISCYPIG